MDVGEDLSATVLEPDKEVCPHCQTTKYQKPSMVLFTSICAHFLCNSCIENLFHSRAKIPCPTCRQELRREDFQQKLFDSGTVHRDVVLRQRRLQDLNLTLENFDNNLDKYNDYLELREDIAFNFANNIDIPETERRMQQFLQEHAAKIAENKHRAEIARKKRLEQRRIEQEMISERRRIAQEKAALEAKRKAEEKKELMKAVANGVSFRDARRQLKAKREAQEQESQATIAAMNTGTATLKAELIEEHDDHVFQAPVVVPLYKYAPRPMLAGHGPPVPPTPAYAASPYQRTIEVANHTEQSSVDQLKAGGYQLYWTLKRGLEEAYAGLYEW
eukprot:TRINITY_DN27613_c0_g1_i2.p1 TRINITY_DN27613_c0_g1~~TRINITY_DN27613_c0_g1_i2.p1  ORF type:complete len:332 (+),score=65.07 TRINITY_DN27613_c0_g1_i2:50-1045(+)